MDKDDVRFLKELINKLRKRTETFRYYKDDFHYDKRDADTDVHLLACTTKIVEQLEKGEVLSLDIHM